MSGWLTGEFELESGEVVVFVGAGGKSTLMNRLATELIEAGESVVITTTTKMGVDQIPPWARVAHTADETVASVQDGPVFLLREVDENKIFGVEPEIVDAVAAASGATVLIEGDGARGRSFKAPGPEEPVIPPSATLVVNVVGIDAVGAPIANCHRPERVSALTGKDVADSLASADVAAVLNHPAGGAKGVPAGARRLAALTKAEPRHSRTVAEIEAALEDGLRLVVVSAEEGLSRT